MLGLPPCGKKTQIGTLRWVALGDSLTVGYGAVPEQSYPCRVVEKSHASSMKLELVKNLANGGHTLAKVQLLQLTRLGLYKPDVVSLWVGTNDALLNAVMGKTFDLASRETLPTSLENFERRLDEVMRKLQKMNLKHIFIGKLHDLTRLPVANDWHEFEKQAVKSIVDGYNHIFDSQPKKHKNVSTVPLDHVAALVDPTLYMRDGVHPKPQAYAAVADCFWNAMQKAILV